MCSQESWTGAFGRVQIIRNGVRNLKMHFRDCEHRNNIKMIEKKLDLNRCQQQMREIRSLFSLGCQQQIIELKMKARKYTEPHIKELNPVEPSTKSQSVSKIIQSYEALLVSLNSKLQQLTIDLQLTREKLGLTETRYATLLCSMNLDGTVDANGLIDKIDLLQRKLVAQNAELARCKSRLLEASGSAVKEPNQENQEGLVERCNLSNYFNFEAIRNNEEILSRKRKNSMEEQSNSFQWDRALELHATGIYSDSKFKEKTMSYLKKFIPYEQRVKVWPIIFENRQGISKTLFNELLQRRSKGLVQAHVVSQIKRDIDRSFRCKMSAENKELLSSEVQEILQIFHLLRPDVSYVQGMTYPVIVLTTVVGKLEAFKIFSNFILNNQFFRDMYSFEQSLIGMCWKVFDLLLKETQPEVAKHLERLKIRSQIFLIEWFFTLFSRGHSLETTMKIWDLLGYQGEILLYRISICIFEMIGKRLLSHNYEHTVGLIQSYWSYIDEGKLLEMVVSSKVGVDRISRAFARAGKLPK